jgi:hypothetical protein
MARSIRRARTFSAALLALLAVGTTTARAASVPATTSTDVTEVGRALRSDPVFVDPDAERALSDDEAASLRSAIASAGTPIFVAVLPASMLDDAGGDPIALTRDVAEATDLAGTYAVLAGDSFRAGSTSLPSGEAGRLATAAFQAHSGDGPAVVLQDFVARVSDAASSGTGGVRDQAGDASPNGRDEGGFGLTPLLLLGGLVLLGVWVWRRRQREKAARVLAERREAADRQMLRAELSVLADDVLRLEDEVALHPEASEDYEAAANRFKAASAALDYADEPIDLERVQRVIDEARYSMDRARAVVAGRPPPDPPAELRRPGRRGEPAVELDEDGRPLYPGYAEPYQMGWFGGGGLFNGLLLGALLGGFGGWGWGGTTVVNEGDTYVGGDGDFGGGGFGGGDFGGGDFGGGDFGGGDFGGS